MSHRSTAIRDLRAGIGPALVVAIGVVAYRTLIWSALDLPDATRLEGWMFRASRQPALLVLSVAGWLLWQRRGRFAALPARGAPWLATAWALLGAALYVWALRTRAAELFLPSLSANLLALGAATRGWSGLRAVGLPALVLLLGVRIPAPLEAEIVWHLQQWSASGAAWLLNHLGFDITRFGVLLLREEASFHVIDACSGLAGIEILVLIAIVIRELFIGTGQRQWWLVVLAPVLGLGLNTARIAVIAATSESGSLIGTEGDHTPQGVAVLAAGTAILYAIAVAMARGGGSEPPSPTGARPTGFLPLRPMAAMLGLLALTSVVVPPFQLPVASQQLVPIEFPESAASWTSTPLESNDQFTGPLPRGQMFYRRYEPSAGGDGAVELFVASEIRRFLSSSHLLSSKLWRPGPDWDVERTRGVRLWALDQEGHLSVAKRGDQPERAVVYTWLLRDGGFWTECWRSLLAIDSSPWRREGRRRVVRLVAFAPFDGSLVMDQAKQRMDGFIASFREELEAL